MINKIGIIVIIIGKTVIMLIKKKNIKWTLISVITTLKNDA